MSSKQKPDPIATQSYQQSLQQAQQKSPVETALNEQALDVINWAKQGDYTQKPKSIFFNFQDPAMRQRQRSQIMGAKGQGVAGLGAPDPNLIALQKNNIAAHQAEDDAAQYEQDISQGVGRAAGMAGDLSQMDQSRKLGVLGATSNVYGNAQRIAASKVPWWQTLLSSAAQGAAAGAAAASDSRLKTNIRPMSERLRSLRGVLFEWGENALALGYDPHRTAGGVLAEDVEQVFPELVTVGIDGFKRVDYMALTGMLVEAYKA